PDLRWWSLWSSSLRLAERLGAANDFHDLSGDGVLTGAVHHAGQGADKFIGIFGRRGHGPLLCGEEGGRAFQEGGEDLGFGRPGGQLRQEGLHIRLEFGVAGGTGGSRGRRV